MNYTLKDWPKDLDTSWIATDCKLRPNTVYQLMHVNEKGELVTEEIRAHNA